MVEVHGIIINPIGTQRRFDVGTTLLQRRNNVVCLLGALKWKSILTP